MDEPGATPERTSSPSAGHQDDRRRWPLLRQMSDRDGGQQRHHSRLLERGELQVLPLGISRRLGLPAYVELFDVRFFRLKWRYLAQATLAALVMLALLLLVDSLADAVLVLGLASSAVIIFVHPNAKSATLRHLVGGHLLGLGVGVTGAILLYHTGWHPASYATDHWIVDVVAAAALGVVILLMSVTDTEHPPAGATALGFAWESLQPTVIVLFIVGVLLLMVSKVALRGVLRDLD